MKTNPAFPQFCLKNIFTPKALNTNFSKIIPDLERHIVFRFKVIFPPLLKNMNKANTHKSNIHQILFATHEISRRYDFESLAP